jgi:aldehyde dehydrogenase (NAD+)
MFYIYSKSKAMVPLIGAIAAGNCVLLKTSRQSVYTSELLKTLLPKYLDMRFFALETKGGAPFITAMLAQKWDHIFFTGSVSGTYLDLLQF